MMPTSIAAHAFLPLPHTRFSSDNTSLVYIQPIIDISSSYARTPATLAHSLVPNSKYYTYRVVKCVVMLDAVPIRGAHLSANVKAQGGRITHGEDGEMVKNRKHGNIGRKDLLDAKNARCAGPSGEKCEKM
jgi:hypothetical protein